MSASFWIPTMIDVCMIYHGQWGLQWEKRSSALSHALYSSCIGWQKGVMTLPQLVTSHCSVWWHLRKCLCLKGQLILLVDKSSLLVVDIPLTELFSPLFDGVIYLVWISMLSNLCTTEPTVRLGRVLKTVVVIKIKDTCSNCLPYGILSSARIPTPRCSSRETRS